MAEFIMVATAHFLALLSPGPDFFIIVTLALRNGSGRAVLTCLGIAVANGVYIVLAIIGFSIVREHPWLITLMKISGAVFLCYIGIMLVRSSRRTLFHADVETGSVDSARKLFMSGFMSAILNPKNPLFYMTLYSVFISTSATIQIQAAYGLWMFGLVFLWDVFIAYSIGNRFVREMLSRYTHRIEQAAGLVIIGLGLSIGIS